jgi:PKD repeat protein
MRTSVPLVLALAGLLVVSGLLFFGLPAIAGSGAVMPPSSNAGPVPAPRLGGGDVEVAPGFSVGPGVHDLGEVASSTPFNVAVGLAPQNAPGLAAYITALYLPGTPAYHDFLSTSALASEYGASSASVATARGYFESYGLGVTVSPDRLLLTVDGPAAEIGSAFGTTFHDYATAVGREFVSHPTPAELPGDIPWTGAYGLGNATPLSPSITPSTALVPVAGPDATCAGGGAGGPYVPCQVWGAYNFTATLQAGTNGTGETIGVVDAYDAQEPETGLENDLRSFDAQFALPTPSVSYLYPVPSDHDLNTTNTGWGDEEALDLEWSHASAPGASIDMTFSPDPDAGLYEDVDYLVAHQSVNVISLSWGEPDVGVYNAYTGPCPSACNASTDGSYNIMDPVLEFAAAEGISVFAASGDCGAADGTSGLATNFPGSDPYVTDVGGTVLNASANGNWQSESGWAGNASGAANPGCQNQGGSGGGYSPLPRPWWQSGPGIASSEPFRGVPDVSAVAAPPGVQYYFGGGLGFVAGTSLATPVWAGITADADQLAHAPLGFLNPSLYATLRGARYHQDFHDILHGNNGYFAGAGWDPVTGIGSPNVGALLPQLVRTTVTGSSLGASLNATVTSGRTPLTVTFSVNASGGSGQYPIEGVYFGDGTSAYAVDGQVAHTYAVAGVFSAQAYVLDSSSNFSASVPIALIVGGGTALSVSLNVSNPSPHAGATVTFNATVNGGRVPFSYRYTFGDGTFENWTSSDSVDHAYGTSGSFCAEVVVKDSGSPPNGGSSLPVALAVGSASARACGSPATSLVASANASAGVRDAPAEFPSLFRVSGGSGTTTEQFESSDPYVAACECTIFRAPGSESVWVYANDTAGQTAEAETNVTVAPVLNATFAASSTYGSAPLRVEFNASAIGGYETDVNTTNWTFGNGNSTLGANVSETYTVPGTYWAIGHLSDRGHGNASEAFLIDVGPTSPAAGAYLSASIDPAIDVPSGGTVRFDASAWTGSGALSDAEITWEVGGDVIGYSNEVNRTFYAPSEGAATYALLGDVSGLFGNTGTNLSIPFGLDSFFAAEAGGFVPSADALVLSDTEGPSTGPAPLLWYGNATGDGPGALGFSWDFGDGTIGATGTNVSHSYGVHGEYTASVRASDPWGDVALGTYGVDVTNGTAYPLRLVSGISTHGGPAPLTVSFIATASGGSGAPYSYLWQFGDGSSTPQPNLTYIYNSPGDYIANITVLDSTGGSAVQSFSIAVSAVPSGPGPVLGFLPSYATLALVTLLSGAVVGTVLAVALRRSFRAGRGPSTP